MVTCSDARLPTLGKEEKPWTEIYRLCLPTSATHRAGFNLRVAVRTGRLRLEKNASSHTSDFRRESVRHV